MGAANCRYDCELQTGIAVRVRQFKLSGGGGPKMRSLTLFSDSRRSFSLNTYNSRRRVSPLNTYFNLGRKVTRANSNSIQIRSTQTFIGKKFIDTLQTFEKMLTECSV